MKSEERKVKDISNREVSVRLTSFSDVIPFVENMIGLLESSIGRVSSSCKLIERCTHEESACEDIQSDSVSFNVSVRLAGAPISVYGVDLEFSGRNDLPFLSKKPAGGKDSPSIDARFILCFGKHLLLKLQQENQSPKGRFVYFECYTAEFSRYTADLFYFDSGDVCGCFSALEYKKEGDNE